MSKKELVEVVLLFVILYALAMILIVLIGFSIEGSISSADSDWFWVDFWG